MSVAQETILDATHKLEDVFGGRETAPSRPYLRWKGILDRVFAVLLIIPGMPMIGLLVLAIRMTSRGPGIYRQERVTKGGRIYKMYKLRSMRIDAESATGAVWTKERDPRITWLGRILRRTHLDELPQLFNVLKGEMSLVGPRPERPEFVSVLAESIPGYMDRLAVLPGITGLAQINLPPDTDLDSVRRKQILDLQYIEATNLYFDLRLLCCTVLRAVGIRGFMPARLLRVYRKVVLEEIANDSPANRCEDATPQVIADQAATDSCNRDSERDIEEEAALRQTASFSLLDTIDESDEIDVINLQENEPKSPEQTARQ